MALRVARAKGGQDRRYFVRGSLHGASIEVDTGTTDPLAAEQAKALLELLLVLNEIALVDRDCAGNVDGLTLDRLAHMIADVRKQLARRPRRRRQRAARGITRVRG